MIFKKLIFKNYKTFYGTQEIDLTIDAASDNKNIILIGGLNGAGKTTFLKAILYILFGKRGITSSTDKKEIEREYNKLFSNVINNTFFDEGGHECSVALVLETDSGAEWTLSVKWYVNTLKKTGHEVRDLAIKETADSPVKKVNNIDNIDTYNRFIDKIIPFYAAPFFIFDGEEIRILIEKQNTAEMKEAIQKISGIKSNDQLSKDLSTLKTRLLNDISKLSNSKDTEDLQEQYNEITLKLNEWSEKFNSTNEKIKEYKIKQRELQQLRQNKLLNNSKSRESISKKIGQIENSLNLKQSEISRFFKNNMIQILLSKKITNLKNRLGEEKKYRNAISAQSAVLQPFENFIEKLLDIKIDPPINSQQSKQLRDAAEKIWFENKNTKENIPYIEELHDLNNSDLLYFQNLNSSTAKPLVQLINDFDSLTTEHETILLQLKNAPDAVDTLNEEKEIEKITTLIGQENLRQASRKSNINKFLDKKRGLEAKLSKNKVSSGDVNQLYAELQYLDRTIKAIVKYEEEYTNQKALIIKTEFESILKKLFRKQDEFGKIEFDIDTFSIRLYNDKMQEISILDRSAGEMQMISSSLIWALTRASNLKLPVVIDTPLGRLDSQHRDHLIEHYYRYLSDQVIILSTDTEITKDYINIMNECSAKQYLLDYDQDKKYTIIRDGYFKFIKDVK